MASFPPLKNYILFCIDQMIKDYNLSSPFLDVGCGIGDASLHLASKGWQGKAIDVSNPAIEVARQILWKHPTVQVEKQSLFHEKGTFKTIIALDILEHLENDREAISKMANLLESGGYLIIAVPTNQEEWRWDDDYFEHFRRYTEEEMNEKLRKFSLRPVVSWDFTYPVFWIMRRLYTWIKKAPPTNDHDKQHRIEICPLLQMWEFPILSNVLSRHSIVWEWIYKWQFRHFRNKLREGHEMIVLAQKNEMPQD